MSNERPIEDWSDEALAAEQARRLAAKADAAIHLEGLRYAAATPVVGRWRVTTEGDCEGRSVRDLGVHEGHVADIAAVLAPLTGYSLHFAVEPPATKPDPAAAAVPRKVSVVLPQPTGVAFNDLPPAQRAAFAMPWILSAPAEHVAVEVLGDGGYYGAVTLKLTPRAKP